MKRKLIIYIAVLAAIIGCRTDETINYAEETETGVPGSPTVQAELAGMYVLNEGNMGSNKCTLDYLDFCSGIYTRNMYAMVNPGVPMELGDVGNDIQIYGSQLWMVINCSNKVEVCQASDAKRIGLVDIPNCRYVTFDGGYAYVSSYVGPVTIDPNARKGRVYKVDTLTLTVVDTVTVGYQPEEMAVVDGKLYVANSGGYRVPNYDHTVSVIDLETFEEERTIDVAINLHRCRADQYGNLWVTSRGDGYDEPARLYCLSREGDGPMNVTSVFDISISDLCIVGDSLYYIGSSFNYITMENELSMGILDIRKYELVTGTVFDSPKIEEIKMPYGIIVNPIDRDFYLMDAMDYVTPGKLLHFKADGTFDFEVRTGDIPGHAAFLWK
ncbi:MAG: YncE family protein [Bacteroidaceae bacterium]|nr:YncE family protein [Bacteroidaceae bacterium]